MLWRCPFANAMQSAVRITRSRETRWPRLRAREQMRDRAAIDPERPCREALVPAARCEGGAQVTLLHLRQRHELGPRERRSLPRPAREPDRFRQIVDGDV